MHDNAMAIATAARRAGLLTALWAVRDRVTLVELEELLHACEYGEELGQLTVADLVTVTPAMPRAETVESAVLRVFRARPGVWLSSGFFVRYLGLRRWTAQELLAALAKRGLLIRAGYTSGTRYCLATDQALRDLGGRRRR